MGERELQEYIARLNKYVIKVKKAETKEQSRAALIRTGVLDKKGKVRKRYQEVVR